MKYTFDEFVKNIPKAEHLVSSYMIEKEWTYQVEESIKSGYIVSDRVLNCHGEIYFDQTGHAHPRNFMNRF